VVSRSGLGKILVEDSGSSVVMADLCKLVLSAVYMLPVYMLAAIVIRYIPQPTEKSEIGKNNKDERNWGRNKLQL